MPAQIRLIDATLPGPPLAELRTALAELLLEYRSTHSDPHRPSTSEWVLRLFHLVGWSSEGGASIHAVGGVDDLKILECDLFGFRAFQVVVSPQNDDLTWERRVEAALTWLYNRGDQWAVVSDFENLEIYNVHWTDKARLFVPFRTLHLSVYLEHVETLALLSPRSIHQRDLFEQGDAEAPTLAFAQAAIGQLTLRPKIELAILDVVQQSRNRFLAAPPRGEIDAAAFDEQVHQLLMRIIFVRACEDMRLAIARPLRDIVIEENMHVELEEILSKYRRLYESELFQPLNLDVFDVPTLRWTISRLYDVADVIRFNFAAVEADILGIMYEEYLKFRAVRKERVSAQGAQEYFFVLERIGTENIKRKQGIYYTPSFLVEAVVERALQLIGAAEGWRSESEAITVADLACGSGAFLASAFRRIGARPHSYQEAAAVLQQHILGVDSDPRAVEATRLNLWLMLFRLHPEVHPLPYLSSSVISRDSLIGPLLTDADAERDLLAVQDGMRVDVPRLRSRPDIIIGNPPFVSLERQAPAYRRLLHDEGYKTLEKRADLANVFIERALDTVREGGIVALVVPNRIFTTRSAEAVRRIIRERARIELIVDFGTLQLFEATTYVSVVFLRRVLKPIEQRTVSTIKFDHLSKPYGLNVREALDAELPPAGVRRMMVSLPTGERPIFFVPQNVAGLLAGLRQNGIPVANIAFTRQGVRIGDQALYLVQEIEGFRETKPEMVRVKSYKSLGKRGQVVAELERAALKPAVHSNTIQRYQAPPQGLWLIYPYDEAGGLIPFEEYADRFPAVSRYLRASIEGLKGRTRTTAATWHKLAEPRDQRWLSAPKLLVPQLAKQGRMTLDDSGLYLVQGYAIVPRSGSILSREALLAALNSTLLVWALGMNSPHYRGDTFEYQGKNIEALTLPQRLLEDSELAKNLADLGRQLYTANNVPLRERSLVSIARLEAEIDAHLYVAAELTSRQVALIEAEAAAYRPTFEVGVTQAAIDIFSAKEHAY
jgi:type I restriction-modification system DNA methylase subunit